MGAMENPGCVTFNEAYIHRGQASEAQLQRRAETILHEMAHMWFGDLVTMKWWDDLWLNESFAEYMGYLATAEATRFKTPWIEFAVATKDGARRQDQFPTTHPIVADIPDVEAVTLNLDFITYNKGAAALQQLVGWVGEAAFFKGIETYFRKHAFGNTDLKDFLGALEDASGRDLRAWSLAWLETAGVNTIEAALHVKNGVISASACSTWWTGFSSGVARSNWTSKAPSRRSRSLPASARPTSSSPTTATSRTARSGSTTAPWKR